MRSCEASLAAVLALCFVFRMMRIIRHFVKERIGNVFGNTVMRLKHRRARCRSVISISASCGGGGWSVQPFHGPQTITISPRARPTGRENSRVGRKLIMKRNTTRADHGGQEFT